MNGKITFETTTEYVFQLLNGNLLRFGDTQTRVVLKLVLYSMKEIS